MKNATNGYRLFSLLLVSFLFFGGAVVFFLTTVPTPDPNKMIRLTVIVMSITSVSLLHLFFHIRYGNREHATRINYETALDELLNGIYREDDQVIERLLQSLVDVLRNNPSAYETYLRNLDTEIQKMIIDRCRLDIKNREISLAKELTAVGKSTLVNSTRLSWIVDDISALEQVSKYCENVYP